MIYIYKLITVNNVIKYNVLTEIRQLLIPGFRESTQLREVRFESDVNFVCLLHGHRSYEVNNS